MANFDASITVRDADGEDSVIGLHLVVADIATAQTTLQNLAELIDDVILGQVVSASISQAIAIGGWALKGAPTAGADREVKGRFIFSTANPKVKPRVSLPTFDKDNWTAVGGDIPFDLGGATAIDVLLVALVDQNFTNYTYTDFNGVLSAYEVFE